MLIVCIVLAAGQGVRLGGKKPLALLWGKPLCLPAVKAALDSQLGPVLVVVPPGPVGLVIQQTLMEQVLSGAVADPVLHFVTNPQPERGLLSSLQVALAALPELQMFASLQAVTLGLADMPFVTAQTYQELRRLYTVCNERGEPPALVLSRYGTDQVNGAGPLLAPPHLLTRALWPEILALPPADQGPRAVIQRHLERAVLSDRPGFEGIDIDTPEALEAAQKK